MSVKEVLDKALQGIPTTDYEFPLFTKDGKRVDVLLNTNPRRDASGHVFGVVGVGQDITSRKAIENELKLVAGDMTRLIDTANAPIFGIDKNGKVNEWNQTAATITKYSKAEVMGKDLVKTYITEEFRAPVSKVLNNALRGVEMSNFEFVLFTKDGARVEVLLNATTRRDATGNIVGVIGVGQDITDLKRAEGRARTSAEDLARLIDTANAPIFGVNIKGHVTEWNQKAVEITGRTTREVMGKHFVSNFISEDFRVSVQHVLDNALKHGQATANFELPLFSKTGMRVEVLLNANPRRDEHGVIYGVVGVGQDITDRKKTEIELQRVAGDLTRLIDTANAPIFGIDENGNVTEWNQTAARITKFSKDEVMGKNLVQNFITKEYRPSVQEVLSNAMRGKETANFEFVLFSKTGTPVEVLLNATSRRDADGRIIGVVGVGQDITNLKRTEGDCAALSLSRNASPK
jgi:PAS domain S-box-containing protein